MVCLLALMAINRIFWHRGYSVVEGVIVFSVVGLIAAAAAALGLFLRPGTFSLRTLLVGVTFAVIVMGELVYLAGG